jgi:predicted HicB family RNase H-like nuclease
MIPNIMNGSKTMLKYKGYSGIIQFDDEAMIFHGEVLGLRDVITFRGSTPAEIKKEFEFSVDGYIDWCHELGQKPEKPFSGNIHLRLTRAPCKISHRS